MTPKHFQVFDYCVRQGWPAGKVAVTLGLNIAQVYLARHRVTHAVKAVARAIHEEGLPEGISSKDAPQS